MPRSISPAQANAIFSSPALRSFAMPLGGDVGRHQRRRRRRRPSSTVRAAPASARRRRCRPATAARSSTLFIVTMSFGATALIDRLARAASRRAPSSSARAVSSSAAENPQALLRTLAHFGGIRSEERRRAGDQRAVDDREVQRHVMPFDAPAPGAVRATACRRPRRNSAPDRGRMRRSARRLAATARCAASSAPSTVSRSMIDGRGQVAALAQAGLEQIVRELALRLGHLLDRSVPCAETSRSG